MPIQSLAINESMTDLNQTTAFSTEVFFFFVKACQQRVFQPEVQRVNAGLIGSAAAAAVGLLACIGECV